MPIIPKSVSSAQTLHSTPNYCLNTSGYLNRDLKLNLSKTEFLDPANLKSKGTKHLINLCSFPTQVMVSL